MGVTSVDVRCHDKLTILLKQVMSPHRLFSERQRRLCMVVGRNLPNYEFERCESDIVSENLHIDGDWPKTSATLPHMGRTLQTENLCCHQLCCCPLTSQNKPKMEISVFHPNCHQWCISMIATISHNSCNLKSFTSLGVDVGCHDTSSEAGDASSVRDWGVSPWLFEEIF